MGPLMSFDWFTLTFSSFNWDQYTLKWATLIFNLSNHLPGLSTIRWSFMSALKLRHVPISVSVVDICDLLQACPFHVQLKHKEMRDYNKIPECNQALTEFNLCTGHVKLSIGLYTSFLMVVSARICFPPLPRPYASKNRPFISG